MKKLEIRPFYNSNKDHIISDFYIPVLSKSKTYKRVSAYFDSNIVSMYSKGIENIVKNNGHIYFIFSNELKEKDYLIIKNSYQERERYFLELKNKLIEKNPTTELMNLGFLIKHGYADIKIAFTKSKGIFHDKFGLCENDEDVVYFRGSNNETVASIQSNFESFETTCSWSASVQENSKIVNAQIMFDELWNNKFSTDVLVMDMPDILKNQFILYSGEKLIYNRKNHLNSVIIDFDECIIITNNLNIKEYLNPNYSFYKRVLEAHVEHIKDDEYYLYTTVGYIKVKELIFEINEYALRIGFQVYLTDRLLKYLEDKDILIEKRRSLGITVKERLDIIEDEFEKFCSSVNNLMVRKLRTPQLWDAFHMSNMIRSANFSVPGAGKTSIVYGAFAYLESIGKVNKIVMVGTINSFSSWIDEFTLCFGDKKELKLFNYQVEKDTSFQERYFNLVVKARDKNLVLINYESLQSNINALESLIDENTLLVFDEVHRIKSVSGIRAVSARKIGVNSKYRVVLTGTPIPNGYIDIFTMLNILFAEEYDIFFGFNESYLKAAKNDYDKQVVINNAINPFFCRTTKEDLKVPSVEPDNIDVGNTLMNEKEVKLYEILYRAFGNDILALYIRLIQASNNPKLVLKNLDKAELNLFDTEDYMTDFSKTNISNKNSLTKSDKEFIKTFDMTSKFYKGIDLVVNLEKNGKVLVWGIFIDTIHRINDELNKKQVKCRVITGATSLSERENIIKEFISGDVNVLITNPHTLGESISLHKTCHQAVYFEYSFNLVHMLQSRDRIHRLGLKETDKTTYYYLMLENPNKTFPSIDYKIYKRLIEKATLQESALSSDFLKYEPDDVLADIKLLFGDKK